MSRLDRKVAEDERLGPVQRSVLQRQRCKHLQRFEIVLVISEKLHAPLLGHLKLARAQAVSDVVQGGLPVGWLHQQILAEKSIVTANCARPDLPPTPPTARHRLLQNVLSTLRDGCKYRRVKILH